MDPGEIKQVLVVAGLSGSGKSTFMRALAEGRLPGDIITSLPGGTGDWPHTSCKFLLENGFGAIHDEGNDPRGLIMHYNMSRPFAFGLADYSSDDGLDFLRSLDAKITVVTVQPAAQTLIEHIRRRATDPHWLAEETADSPLLRKVRRRVRASALRWIGMQDMALKKGQMALIRHYEVPGNVERWHGLWDVFLGSLRENRPDTRLVYVTPDEGARAAPNFRLVDASRTGLSSASQNGR